MSKCCWMLSFQVLRSTHHSSGDTHGLQSPRASASGYLPWPDHIDHWSMGNSPAILNCFSHDFPCSKAFFQAPDRFRNLACSTALAPEATDINRPFLRSRQCPRQPNIARLCQTCHFAVSFVDVEGWKNMALACDTPLELCQFHSVSTVALRSLRENCFQWQSTSRFPATSWGLWWLKLMVPLPGHEIEEWQDCVPQLAIVGLNNDN